MPVDYRLLARIEAERNKDHAPVVVEDPEPTKTRKHGPVYKPRPGPGTWSTELELQIEGLRRAQQLVEARERRIVEAIERGQKNGASLRQIAELCEAGGLKITHQSVANLVTRVKARK